MRFELTTFRLKSTDFQDQRHKPNSAKNPNSNAQFADIIKVKIKRALAAIVTVFLKNICNTKLINLRLPGFEPRLYQL